MRTILIADDEPALRILLHATIRSDRHQVLEAEDGDRAWDLIREHRPVLALLDVQMPGRTGLELARAIKADPELTGTRVVILTAKAQESDRQAGQAAGADLYLTKPFSPLQLLQVLEQALEGT